MPLSRVAWVLLVSTDVLYHARRVPTRVTLRVPLMNIVRTDIGHSISTHSEVSDAFSWTPKRGFLKLRH